MVNIKHKNGFLIENKFLFGFETADPKYINLALEPGTDMRYEKLEYALVDYPGEYDIQWIGIECFLGANNKLNYILSTETKKIGIIQSADVLDLDVLWSVKVRLYLDDKILNKIDQLELEWEKQKLEIVENN
ncbi:MAG: hypothetical protein ACD_80C00131G0025 [uncultured bacterium (gcode 4)]|uniref:Uncharacterized protein n=1 Tax=uncultured bacterium (gcode 4) TaxID=1234023 RepID=K1XIL7_9BACT|nr:MAG: hypothetical protein ACD_80C00131G0025 [uncultured bacterium (gcode 4)]